jgi:nitroreductase
VNEHILHEPTRADLLELIEAAVRAPSADNQHHFRFVVRDDGLDMLADAFFMSCQEPHRRLLTLLSYGAAAENMRLRLTQRGRAFVPEWFPDGPDDPCLLRVRVADWTTAPVDALASRIDSRHTNRRLFKRLPLSTVVLQSLAAATASIDDVTLDWFDRGPRRRAVLHLMRIAETARFASPSLHRELFESVDFSAGWRQSVAEHLAPATLEVEPFLRGAFAALRHPRIMRIARGGGAHYMLGLRAGYVPAATAPQLGVLASPLPPDDAALAIGRAFQRLWLAADAAGVALQPMVASTILAWQDPGGDPIRQAIRQRLRKGWEELSMPAVPLVAFRLGHAKPPAVKAGRRPASDYIVT